MSNVYWMGFAGGFTVVNLVWVIVLAATGVI